MDAFQLYNEKGTPTGVWCCGKCRKLVLEPAWRPSGDSPKSTQEAAESCCRPPTCVVCGKEMKPGYDRECSECRDSRYQRERAARQLKRLEAAEDVSATYEGPVYYEGTGGDMGEGYHSSVEQLAESLYDDGFDDPDWAFACESRQLKLDLDHAIENLCSDSYEGMEDQLTIPQSLRDAVAEFNEINKVALTVYECDYKRKVRVIPHS